MRKYRYWLILVVLSLLLVQCAPSAQAPAGEEAAPRRRRRRSVDDVDAPESVVHRRQRGHHRSLRRTAPQRHHYHRVLPLRCIHPDPADRHARRHRSRHHGVVRLVGLPLFRPAGRDARLRDDLQRGRGALLQGAAGRLLLWRQALRPTQRVQHRERRRHGQQGSLRGSRADLPAAVGNFRGSA